MSGEKVIQASAIIDVQVTGDKKIDDLRKKIELISATLVKASTKTTAFDKLDKSMAKVAAGTDKVAKSVAALDKGFAGLGTKSTAAASGAASAFGQVARSATTAEVALQRMARAQTAANNAMGRASRSARPGLVPPAPAPTPRRGGGGAPGHGSYRDRYGRLIEATVGVDAAEGAATRAVKAGAELEKQRVDATAAGLAPTEAAEVEERSLALSRKYPTVPQTALMRMIRNARAATGDLEDALAVMDPLTKLRVLAQAKKPGADVSGEFETLVKGLEIKGVAQHPEEFVKYMDGMAKAINVFGEQVTPSSYYQMFKYGRGSTRGLSDDYMLSVAPTLAAELGGSSTGVAGQAFYQSIVGRRLKKASLEEMEGLGLLVPEKIHRNKKGEPERVDVGGVVGADLARADPYRWVNTVMLPAMAKKGITDPNDVTDHIAAIFGNSLAQQLVSILATQQKRIEKDRNNLGNAQGLVAADEYLARDPGQALGAFTSQLENLLANASSPMMPAATAALRGLADALGALAEKAKEHPAAASAGLAGGIVGLGLGGAWLTRKILGLLGFGGGSASGTATAAAAGGGGVLGRVLGGALRLGRAASLPAAAISAIVAATVAGYEAADDTGRQHPYGRPGESWERRRRQNASANRELNESRARADARRAYREGTLMETYPDRGFHDVPLRPRPADDLGSLTVPMPRPRPVDALGELVPVPGAGGTGTAGAVGVVNTSLDQAAAKIVDALNGRAEVGIKVEATREFIVSIVSLVKHEMAGFSLTGPGSTGRSDTNVDQHQ